MLSQRTDGESPCSLRHDGWTSEHGLFCFLSTLAPPEPPVVQAEPLSGGCVFQAEVVVNYHVGETVLSLQKTTLIPGGSESLVYTTLSGGIGILVPFTSHEVNPAGSGPGPVAGVLVSDLVSVCLQDHDFFQHLEMHMRSEFPPLCGRDHLSFRSYYFPVKVSGSGAAGLIWTLLVLVLDSKIHRDSRVSDSVLNLFRNSGELLVQNRFRFQESPDHWGVLLGLGFCWVWGSGRAAELCLFCRT